MKLAAYDCSHLALAMRVGIAEDHAIFREVMIKLCREFGHDVVGVTDSGVEAAKLCLNNTVEMLLLDMSLSDVGGGIVVDALSDRSTCVKVVVVSAYLGDYLIYRLENLPAFVGFIDKPTVTLETLREAIGVVGSNRHWFSNKFRDAHVAFRSKANAFHKLLSNTEQMFLRYVAQNLSDIEIASNLGISIRSIENRRSILLQKLDLDGAIKLPAYARGLGFDLFPPPTLVGRPLLPV